MQNNVEAVRHVMMRRVFVAQLVLIGIITTLFGAAIIWDLGSFWFAFGVGILGASIALIRQINRGDVGQLDRLVRSWFGLLMPLLYGGVMAAVAYGLFMSGILSGEQGGGLLTTNLFPRFTNSKEAVVSAQAFLEIRPQTIQDLGKLLIWCFLAGYSESFIASILGRLEQVNGSGNSTVEQQ